MYLKQGCEKNVCAFFKALKLCFSNLLFQKGNTKTYLLYIMLFWAEREITIKRHYGLTDLVFPVVESSNEEASD